MEQVELAPRFRDAQHWWLVAELARRNPDLAVVETHLALGAADCLTLVDGSRWVVSIERVGVMYLHTTGGPNIGTGMEFEADNPYELLKTIERLVALPAPLRTPAATPRSLVYRIAARLMLTTVNDEQRLDVRSVLIDSGDDDRVVRDGLQRFPIAQQRATENRPDDPMGQALHRYWLVRRKEEAVAVLDTDGFAYVGRHVFHLPTVYAANKRRTISVLHTCFADILC